MIWVITAPEAVPGEALLIQELAAAGASRILLRKPEWKAEQYCQLLDNIDPKIYPQLLVRDNCWIYNTYHLAGVHWSSKAKAALSPQQLHNWVKNHPSSSTGVHNANELADAENLFDYLLLSPVYNSISKTNYQQMFTGPAPEAATPVLALGGVDVHNIGELPARNFSGAAVLGAIWQEPQQAVNNFLQLQQGWQEAVSKHSHTWK
ncbi:thiamine-phosphate pyrophosphorylase [Chitinophaga jiangningensis]|uniref:Thiamine-phosphate pyrophosphorylase n=1 Tax=Chitinophaga jiangningensis TaxID=1419482 RepID=A0A1M7EA37_9BACT|nr:thiamine phosphate synthase [Chitinophaga jiangningensis]SHL88615.1 thiamine-phosphate pyrophosphorylase [Chitinophaga jiangningensis]